MSALLNLLFLHATRSEVAVLRRAKQNQACLIHFSCGAHKRPGYWLHRCGGGVRDGGLRRMTRAVLGAIEDVEVTLTLVGRVKEQRQVIEADSVSTNAEALYAGSIVALYLAICIY